MRTTRAVSLFVLSLVTATALSARAAGLITALTSSANPVNINTDVTFTVKGMSGGCPEVILDYGDGQRTTMTKVKFKNNTSITSPAHKYASAKTYTVKANPGRGCTGTATLNLVVTSASGGGGGGGGGLGRVGGGGGGGGFDRNAGYSALATRGMDRAGPVFRGSALQPPPSPCPQIKAKFDAALDWAMKGGRPDVCDYTIWDSGCENLLKAVGSCNANNCPEKCHNQDTLVIDVTRCGNPSVFKQLVNSYSGMSQESRDACLARLQRAGL